jgi:hypothetical protein
MWIFTDVADWFDKTRNDNDAWIDAQLQPWVATTLYDDSPWYRNLGVWTAAGTLYALNKFTTTIASGFVDVLRLGDGVKEGGWGYGKDALRLLMVVGPALRTARYAVSLVPAVDALQLNNCSWVAAARLLRLTGARPLAELSDVAKWMGLGAEETAEIWPRELTPAMRSLGANVREGSLQTGTIKELAKVTLRENPQAATLFSVRFNMGGESVGHTLIAVRSVFGGMKIIDRTGRMVNSLIELEDLYPGIGSATVDAKVVVGQNTIAVKSLGTLPTLANVVSQGSSGFDGSPAKGAPRPDPNKPLSADAQSLLNAVPPSGSISRQALMAKTGLSGARFYQAVQELEGRGFITVVRFGNDDLNIVQVARR